MDTIAAIATPFCRGGIGIVRISGPQGIPIARRLFRKSPAPVPGNYYTDEPAALVSHRVQHGYIIDPNSGLLIDEVILVPMFAPNSYTREDVVEIQSHSGLLLLQKLLSLVLDCGARLADPGEFTRRAFLNGRIDLSQAEGVIDLINARSEIGLNQAANQLKGAMRDQIQQLIQCLTQICVEMQGAIEFSDEQTIPEICLSRQSLHCHLIQPIVQLLKNFQGAHLYRDGLRLSIVGKPNVGKSSILNRLLDSDKAIVTPFPGTTRDPVEAVLLVHGIPVNVTDTAGLHTTQDPVEQIGIQKTRESIALADHVIFVVEAGQPFGPADESVFLELPPDKTLVVVNKIDLASPETVQLPAQINGDTVVPVSALDGTGFDELKIHLVRLCGHATAEDTDCRLVPTVRQKKSLENAMNHLLCAVDALELEVPADMILSDLETANNELKTIVGQSPSIDLLDAIFSQFCIGK